jgi:5'-nucleotidase
MDEPEVLLTNDDGIDSTGLGALYDGLSAVGNVTAVAPATDKSAVGRSISRSVTVHDHERGYAIEGTPVDCVVAGLSTLCPETDIVVSGCNRGANLGSPALGRSGTVSAAVEASFFDVPAISVSAYIPAEEFAYGADFSNVEVPDHQYTEAVEATNYLIETCLDSPVFEHADYLNLNAPITDRASGEMVLTRPSHVYQMTSKRKGEDIVLEDTIWESMADGDIPDPEGTDRRAVLNSDVSVSALTAPHTTEEHDHIEAIVTDYPGK